LDVLQLTTFSYQVWEGVYKSPTPLVMSHEPVGTIVAMGAKAKAAGKWKIGQRVGYILMKHPCKKCIGCETFDDVKHCENKQLAGLQNDGGMAEYSLADPDSTVLLPDDLPFDQAAPLMCAGVSPAPLNDLT
jgi:D-arabinose 1-dehydrogenase-like Zn-dependent alcohol dehydrogenase